MNSREFTIEVINNLVKTFPNIKCFYDFDGLTDTHYVEILPESEFDSNENLNNLLDDYYFEFIDKYNQEAIAFISNLGNRKLRNILFEKEGKEFNRSSNIWILNEIQSYVNIPTLDDEFYLEEDYSLAA
jgi:hypothetical protein